MPSVHSTFPAAPRAPRAAPAAFLRPLLLGLVVAGSVAAIPGALAQSSLAPVPGSLAPPRAAAPGTAPAGPPRPGAPIFQAPPIQGPAAPSAAPRQPPTRQPPSSQPPARQPPVRSAPDRQPPDRQAPARPARPQSSAAPPTIGRATQPPNRRPAAAAVAAGAAAGAAAASARAADPGPAAMAPAPPGGEAVVGPVTGLPLPRFAALRSDEVNMRVGPSTSYPIEWTFQRRDLPVQIIGEFQLWRRIRDPDGAEGWVHSSTLAGRRTVLIRIPDAGTETTLRRGAEANATAVARLRPGVIARIRECEADVPWCEVQVAGYRGYLRRAEIWGVGAAEEVK